MQTKNNTKTGVIKEKTEEFDEKLSVALQAKLIH